MTEDRSIRRVRLLKDPDLPWQGSFPYDWLDARLRAIGHRGLGYGASAAEIKDAYFDLLAAGAQLADRSAWDELRFLGRRLLVDFLLYRVAEPDRQALGELCAEREMPLEMPDLLALADVEPDWQRALEPAQAADPGKPPRPVSPAGASGRGGLLDLGPVAVPVEDDEGRKYG